MADVVITAAAVVAFTLTNGVAHLRVPVSGVDAVPFAEESRDLVSWTVPAGQASRMESSWHWVVEVPVTGFPSRVFFRARYRLGHR